MDPGSRDLDFVILIYPSPTYLGGKSYVVGMGVYQGIVSHTPHALGEAASWYKDNILLLSGGRDSVPMGEKSRVRDDQKARAIPVREATFHKGPIV